MMPPKRPAPSAQAPPTGSLEHIPAQAWITLVVISAAVMMVSMELSVIALALPAIREAFDNPSPAALSWVVSAYSITVAALLLLSGWLADRYGRKRLFLTGLAVFVVGSLGSAAALNLPMLIASRAVQALGGAMQFPAGLALLLTTFPRSRHQFAIGAWGAAGGLAAALGPTLGALLLEGLGWRSVFYINVPIAVAGLVIGTRNLVESKGENVAQRVDVIGVPLASIGVGVLILGIVEGEAWGWSSAPVIGSFALGALLITAFVKWSLYHPATLFDLKLLRIRSYALGNLGSLFFCMGFFAMLFPLPTFIQDVWGWSAIQTGFAIAPGPLVSFVASPIAGRIADRIGNAPILTLGAVSGMAGIGLWLFTMSVSPSFGLLLVGNLLVGLAAGTGFAQLTGAAMRDIPPSEYAMAAAGRTTFFQMSVALAIAVAFAVIGNPAGPEATLSAYRAAWVLCVCGYACNFVLFAFVYPRAHERKHPMLRLWHSMRGA